MYKTRLGFERLTFKQRVMARELMRSLPIAFSCSCNQCGCGCLDTVVFKKITYCRQCARPKITPKGDRYGLEHLWCCSKKNK